jgi:glutamate synthase (NADPH/NADH) small chain
VLLALGFVGPVQDGLLKQLGVGMTERGTIASKGYATTVPKVYAAGDMRRGQSLVVWAIAEGRQAAEQIDRDLRAAAR